MDWKVNYMSNIMSRTLAEQCCDAGIRQSTASGMFVCVHHNPLLDWKTQIACHVRVFCRTLPWSAVSSLRCVLGTQSINGQEHSIIGPLSFHILCSSESRHDGYHAASGVCLYRPLRDRNTHRTSNGCALSRALSRWAMSNHMCVPTPVHQWTGILNYTLNIMSCTYFSRTPP